MLIEYILMNSNFYGLESFLFEKEFLYIIIFKQIIDCNFLASFYPCIVIKGLYELCHPISPMPLPSLLVRHICPSLEREK